MSELRTLSTETLSAVILNGDLSKLNSEQKVEYIVSLCQRVGLDPATQPFKLLKLQGKEIAYADRSCAAQLNKLHNLAHQITATEQCADFIMMTDRCSDPSGRFTEEVGAVPLAGLKGEALTNALMKCRTKAMRRSTLTHVGLGMLDESETETIPGAVPLPLPVIADAQATTHAMPPTVPVMAEDVFQGYCKIMEGAKTLAALQEAYKVAYRATDEKDTGTKKELMDLKDKCKAAIQATLEVAA